MSTKRKVSSRAHETTSLRYQLLRNTTSPDENSTGVQSFVANLPAEEVVTLDTSSNLRGYIAEYNPRKRNRVHDAIRETIDIAPERFITRNGGIVITASDVKVDDKDKKITLTNASIINGAQTQGEIKRFLDELFDDPEDERFTPFYVRAEIIVDSDPSQVVETAIARNFATPVKSVSQAGARGHLTELVKSVRTQFPSIRVKTSETDEEGEDPIRILQYARLLMPASVSGNTSASETLRAYKNPAQCLQDFSKWYEHRDTDPDAKRKYEFTVQMAPVALAEYRYWESHDAWNGHQLWEQTKKGGRACRRDKNKKIIWVAPGILFPLLKAMSEFVVEDKGRWTLEKPSNFKPKDMVQRAVRQFRGHDSDPMALGRSEAAYEALKIYPQTLVEVLRDVARDSDRESDK